MDDDPTGERFLLDVMLGTLAVYLRACGHDAAYALDRGIEADDRIVELSDEENRRLLTRDRALAERVDDAIEIVSRDVEAQLTELREAGIDLEIAAKPARCGRCNGELRPVSPDAETPEHAPDPATTDCWRCRSCGQLFWKGSHHERMKQVLEDVENGLSDRVR
jgi:uncharacterized protein with PIN domain